MEESKFPAQLYIQRQEDGEVYFAAFTNIDEINGDDGPVAIYEVGATGEIRTTKALVLNKGVGK